MSIPGRVIKGGPQFQVTHVINQDCGVRHDIVGVHISRQLALTLMGVLLRYVSLNRDPIFLRIKGDFKWPHEAETADTERGE